MAFKMKGSPMARNFGISPMKDDKSKAIEANPEIQEKNKERIETNKKNKVKFEQYLQLRKNEFTKDSEGIYKDSDGKSVSERYKVDKNASQRDRLKAGQ